MLASEAADGKQFTGASQREGPGRSGRGFEQAVAYLTRYFLAEQPPVGGHSGHRLPRRSLHVDQSALGYHCRCSQAGAYRIDQGSAEGRVDEHDLVAVAGALQEPRRRHAVAIGPRFRLQYAQVLFDLAQRCSRGIHEVAAGGAAGQRLETQRAAAGKQVQAAGTVDRRCQPVEQGFAHPVRSRSQALGGGKAESASAPLPADDAQGALFYCAFAGSGHFVALGKGVRIGVFLQALACAHSSTTIMKFFKRKKGTDEQPGLPETAAETAAEPADSPAAQAPAPVASPEPIADPDSAAEAATANPDKGEKAEDKTGFFSRLRRGLNRTSENLVQGMGTLFLGRKEIDEDLLEELESRLLLADVGVDATRDIIGHLTQRVSRKELTHAEGLQAALREELLALLKPCENPLDVAGKKPFVILMVGVNGVGKTTTIGKLARRYMAEGRSVMLAAGDTFRAAAVEQLQVWGERNDVPVIAQHTGADSASVLFDALQAAKARNVDVLIADTAGRLHNKDNLMEELKKVVRVMAKLDPEAPHEVMLVLDAGTGQNALSQADQFQQWVGVSGITLTKLDGTAKGGVIFAIARKLGLPIRYIGVGEAVEDLRPFQAKQFIEALFAGDDATA